MSRLYEESGNKRRREVARWVQSHKLEFLEKEGASGAGISEKK